MKAKRSFFLTFFLSLFLIVILPSFLANPAVEEETRGVSYVESSTGLGFPQWESGRTELEMGDVNGDGKVDIASIGDHGNPLVDSQEEGIMVWFGDGRGSWSNFMYGHLGYGGIALGDVNNDGTIDVGYGMHHNGSGVDLGDQILEVALGNGTGQYWTAWDDGLATNGETWGMFSTDFADVDNDGDLDLGSVSFGAGAGLHVYINQGNGSWVQSFGFLGGNSSMQFYFGDVNGDGNADMATSQEKGTVYLGDGYGNFKLADGNLPPIPQYQVRNGAHLGDVNHDGYQDLSYINSNGGIEVWLWNGNNTWVDGSGTLPDTGNYEATQLYDMDLDGNIDVTAMGRKVTVWEGDGTGNWTLLTDFPVPGTNGNHEAFRVGADADHNGFPDIVFVSEQGNWPSERNYLHFYKEASTPNTLKITPVYPRGNEKFVSCSVRFIDWVSAVPSSQDFGTVTLELSTNGSSGPWNVIAGNLPDNGRHQWIVSSDRYSNNGYIRYTITNNQGTASAITPASFDIISGPLKLFFIDKETIDWESCEAADHFNIYRSDWDRFLQTGEYTQDPSTVPHAARFCHISTPPLTDPFVPPEAGEMVFYLITPNKGGTEGSLGRNSSGSERANANPCP